MVRAGEAVKRYNGPILFVRMSIAMGHNTVRPMSQWWYRFYLWVAFGIFQLIVFGLQYLSAKSEEPWLVALLACLSILVEVLALQLLAFLLRCHFGRLERELKGVTWWERIAVNCRKAWQIGRASALCQWTVSVADGHIEKKQCERHFEWAASGGNGEPSHVQFNWLGIIVDGGAGLSLSSKDRLLRFSCVGTSMRPYLSRFWDSNESIINVEYRPKGREQTFLFVRSFLGKWEGLVVYCPPIPEEFFPDCDFVTPCMRFELPFSGRFLLS